MSEMAATKRLYWEDDHCLEAEAVVVGVREDSIAFDRTCFYPGGGGQPHDTGIIRCGDETVDIVSVQEDAENIIWHFGNSLPQLSEGQRATLIVNSERRMALTRYHSVLHVLNTIALRDYNGWITGVQIGVDYSRIDFKLEGFNPDMRTALETKVNTVLQGDHAMRAYTLPENEFRARTDLLRTLEVQPPVYNGRVRVVEIEGFDAQACGGTHVRALSEVGRFSIYKTENKGKINKRLYVKLEL